MNNNKSQKSKLSGSENDGWTLVSPPNASSSSSSSSSLVNLVDDACDDVQADDIGQVSSNNASSVKPATESPVISKQDVPNEKDSSISNLNNIKNMLDSLSENVLKQSTSRSTFSKSDYQYTTDTDDMSSDIEDGDDEDDEDYDDNQTEMSSANSTDSTNNSDSISSYGGMDILTDNDNSEGDIEDFMKNVVDNKAKDDKIEDMIQEIEDEGQSLDKSFSAKHKLKNDASKHKYRPINVKKVKVKVQKHRQQGQVLKAKLKSANNSIVCRTPNMSSQHGAWKMLHTQKFVFMDSRSAAILVLAILATLSLTFLFPIFMTFFGSLELAKFFDAKTTSFKSIRVYGYGPRYSPINTDILLSESQLSAIKELHDEILTCLQRQSPSFIKYYSSQINQNRRLGDPRKNLPNSNMKKNKNLAQMDHSDEVANVVVCYSRENYWKDRIEALSVYHDLDLRTLIRRLRDKIGDNFIGQFYRDTNPEIKLTPLFNQLEYLDALEDRRNKKRLEDTVNQLQAENIELLRRLSQPRDEEYQQIMIGLEMRISKLQKENNAIKDTLSKKAGTMYMKQLIELEQLDRENDQFKQFYNHISRSVSKSLKLMDTKANVVLDFLPLDEQMNNLGPKLKSVEDGLDMLTKNLNHIVSENDEMRESLEKIRRNSQSMNEFHSMNIPYAADIKSQIDLHKLNESDSIQHKSSNKGGIYHKLNESDGIQHKNLHCQDSRRWFDSSSPLNVIRRLAPSILQCQISRLHDLDAELASKTNSNNGANISINSSLMTLASQVRAQATTIINLVQVMSSLVNRSIYDNLELQSDSKNFNSTHLKKSNNKLGYFNRNTEELDRTKQLDSIFTPSRLGQNISTTLSECTPLTELLTKLLFLGNQSSSINKSSNELPKYEPVLQYSHFQQRLENLFSNRSTSKSNDSSNLTSTLLSNKRNLSNENYKPETLLPSLSSQSAIIKRGPTKISHQQTKNLDLIYDQSISDAYKKLLDNVSNHLNLVDKDHLIGSGQIEKRKLKLLLDYSEKFREEFHKKKATVRPKHHQIGSNSLQLSDLRYDLSSKILKQSFELVTDIAIKNLIDTVDPSEDRPTEADTILRQFDILYESMVTHDSAKHDQNPTKSSSKSNEYSIKNPIHSKQKFSNDELSKMGYKTTPKDNMDDAWYLKRAKQRKRLRRVKPHHSNLNLHSSFDGRMDSDWFFERAKIRERQRRFSQKIHDYYNNDNCLYDKMRMYKDMS